MICDPYIRTLYPYCSCTLIVYKIPSIIFIKKPPYSPKITITISNTYKMPSLSSIMEQNSKVGPQLKNLVAVFVGGTCGIGEHTAYTFAKYTKSPTIYIIGRNKEAGAKVLENLRQLNSDADSKYYFYSHDLTLISEADKLNQTVLDQEDKINVLFLSAGYIAMDSRNESSEGIDKKMAVNYYSRWKIADELTPLVEKAADAGELSRVVSVLKAGEEGFIHPEDIGLKKSKCP